MSATDGILRSWMLRAARKGWPVAPIVTTSIIFVAALSLFLFVRRATGAFTDPLPAPQLVAIAIVMCAWALAVRELTAKHAIFFWLSLVTTILVAIACSFPAARFVDWLIWVPAIGCIAALPFESQLRARLPGHRAVASKAEDETSTESERTLQQLTRVRTAAGKDAIRGSLTAEFAPGERQTTLYVGFCPPFELLPEVEATVNDDFEADVKLAQVLHNGAQLDVRLSEPAEEPLAISIEFSACEAV